MEVWPWKCFENLPVGKVYQSSMTLQPNMTRKEMGKMCLETQKQEIMINFTACGEGRRIAYHFF